MDMLAGYLWRTMDKYWRTLLDILYGDLVWRLIGYLRISLDILFGYLFQEMFMRVSKRYPKSPTISEDIPPYLTISEDIRGYPMGRTPRCLWASSK
jgi:hypothetical protein